MNDARLPARASTQLKAILKKDPDADRIALVWPEPTDDKEIICQVDGVPVRIVYCPSELGIRETLVDHRPGERRLVILSPLDQAALAKDVLARLWNHEPKRINPWRTLQDVLGVHSIDPRLTGKNYRWIAETLVGLYDRYCERMVFANVLDIGTAWRAIMIGLLDFDAAEPDIDSLLEWSLTRGVGDRLRQLPQPVTEHLGDWLSPRLGTTSTIVECLWANDQAENMVGIGLVCELLYARHREPEQAIFQARGQFTERFLGGSKHDDRVLLDYGQACANFAANRIGGGRRSGLEGALATAERILASLDLTPIAVESNLLTVAFGQRLDDLSSKLRAVTRGKFDPAVHAALGSVQSHQLARVRTDQVNRAALAVKAASWLAQAPETPHGMTDLVRMYVRDGGFVDWATSQLWPGDEHEGLNRVYAKLSRRVAEIRDTLNQAFSEHLGKIARGDVPGDGITFVEHCLDGLIVPLVKQTRVLLLVVDGMSQAVYRELASDLSRNQWVELQRDPGIGPDCLLATLPSTTRASRHSLLSGRLGVGASADEKKAFSTHPGLKHANANAILLHKAELQEPGRGGLSTAAREKIADTRHRLVGLVINAVDDQLSSNAQVSVRWSIEHVGLLRQVLEAARDAARIVVLTSDHGHVLDHAMTYRKSTGDTERYKPATGKLEDGEILLEGPRVLEPDGRAIVPWTDKIRYGKEKKGYHGGSSLQEMVIPFGVFRSGGDSDELAGWTEIPEQFPSWWLVDSGGIAFPDAARTFQPAQPALRAKRSKQAVPATRDLFEEPASDASFAWLTGLFESSVYADMKSRAGRVLVTDDQVHRLLVHLAGRGGQSMMSTVGQNLGIPAIRVSGFLAGVQKLLNVEGYPVLVIDRSSRTVKLNAEALKTQFEL